MALRLGARPTAPGALAALCAIVIACSAVATGTANVPLAPQVPTRPAPGAADAPVGPELSLRVTPDAYLAYVSERPFYLIFGGFASVDQPWFVESYVELTVDCVWSAAVGPSPLHFQGTHELMFEVRVSVPAGAAPGVSTSVTIGGTCRTGGVAVSTATTTANITTATYDLVLSGYDGESCQIPRGGSGDVRVYIENRANMPVLVTLELIEAPAGVKVTLPGDSLECPSGGKERVDIAITLPEEVPDEPQVVKIAVHVRDMDGNELQDRQLVIGYDIASPFPLSVEQTLATVVLVAVSAACSVGALLYHRRRRAKRSRPDGDIPTDVGTGGGTV